MASQWTEASQRWTSGSRSTRRGSMRAPDVNILIYAYISDSQDHTRYARWRSELLTGEGFGISELVISGFLRVATNRRVFGPQAKLLPALHFADAIPARENCVRLR